MTVAVLSDDSELRRLERVIEKGRASFTEVGEALLRIRDGRLYRETHRTFEDYCRERWGFSSQRGYQMMTAARDVLAAPTTVGKPKTEWEARRKRSERNEPVKEHTRRNPKTGGIVKIPHYTRSKHGRIQVQIPISEALTEFMGIIDSVEDRVAPSLTPKQAQEALTVRFRGAYARRLRKVAQYIVSIAVILEQENYGPKEKGG